MSSSPSKNETPRTSLESILTPSTKVYVCFLPSDVVYLKLNHRWLRMCSKRCLKDLEKSYLLSCSKEKMALLTLTLFMSKFNKQRWRSKLWINSNKRTKYWKLILLPKLIKNLRSKKKSYQTSEKNNKRSIHLLSYCFKRCLRKRKRKK